MVTKRELVEKAFNGEVVDRVPVGFWFHFTEKHEWLNGLESEEIYQKNLRGHQNFLKTVQPDFIKLMSDGFFRYPNPTIHTNLKSAEELNDIKPLPDNHPWFEKQVQLLKEIKASFEEDIVAVYNIFSPATHLKWQLADEVSSGDDRLADLLLENPELVQNALNVIAEDLAKLVKRLLAEVLIDGIYLSVQKIQDERIATDAYPKYIQPADLIVLEAAEGEKGLNILHICGYEGATNDVTVFKDYPVKVFNWAVKPEGISLKEGRKLFGGKTVLGGFENEKDSLIAHGTRQEIEDEVQAILAETGRQGIILGADCTIPSNIDTERIQWVRNAAK
ncbi:uroporphyrinogen decarboxylase [Streptococcus rupicaprae]|uniref:Uroporphyrinogen decarboxylase n=2 Tax=Streptococcus rupicaprae TaxID=759619 RepID=A0ABV2FHY0_9STRE